MFAKYFEFCRWKGVEVSSGIITSVCIWSGLLWSIFSSFFFFSSFLSISLFKMIISSLGEKRQKLPHLQRADVVARVWSKEQPEVEASLQKSVSDLSRPLLGALGVSSSIGNSCWDLTKSRGKDQLQIGVACMQHSPSLPVSSSAEGFPWGPQPVY